MITKGEILQRTKELAKMINEDYGEVRPVLVCVLKGANPVSKMFFYFASRAAQHDCRGQLLTPSLPSIYEKNKINFHDKFYQHLLEELQKLKQGYTMEFLRVSSYEGTESTGVVSIREGLQRKDLAGRHVILVEDIVDTGTTLSRVIPALLEEDDAPKSVEVCALLEKRLKQPPKIQAKYLGFTIPNHFIIGYGLDYNELYRDVADIWVISQAGIDFDQSTLNL